MRQSHLVPADTGRCHYTLANGDRCSKRATDSHRGTGYCARHAQMAWEDERATWTDNVSEAAKRRARRRNAAAGAPS